MKIKAITLYQPYASLKVTPGAKECETRGWPMPSTVRQGDLVAIHAGALNVATSLDRYNVSIAEGLTMRDALGFADLADLFTLPRGAVVGICRFEDCLRAEDLEPDERELCFGDFSDGRFAWRMPPVYALPEPVLAKGKQGLWEWQMPQWVESAMVDAGVRV